MKYANKGNTNLKSGFGSSSARNIKTVQAAGNGNNVLSPKKPNTAATPTGKSKDKDGIENNDEDDDVPPPPPPLPPSMPAFSGMGTLRCYFALSLFFCCFRNFVVVVVVKV
jgi:hypothetical protein